MRYPFEVMFTCASGRFKAMCETQAEVNECIETYGVDNLLFIQENY